jgi:TolB-like protein
MNKVFLVFFLLVIFSCSTVPNYYSFDNALVNSIQNIETELPKDADVAILDFRSGNQNLSSYVIEELYDKLINSKKLSIMERSRNDTIAIEIGYQLSGEVDDKEIISIGHQLGAEYVVTGQIDFSGEAYQLRIFAIDIEKGKRVISSSLKINPKDRQLTYLLSSEINTRQRSASDEKILLDAVKDLLKNIPNNSSILITGIIGNNRLRAQYIQSVIENEAMKSYPVIDEVNRDAIIKELSFMLDSTTAIGTNLHANIIIAGGVFGNDDLYRILFWALNVETRQIIYESCVLFNQNNTNLVNNAEALSQKINEGLYRNIRNNSTIGVVNNVKTNREADFIFDIIESSLVNSLRYKVVTMTNQNTNLIEDELNSSYFSGEVNETTSIRLDRILEPQYILNIEYINNGIQVNVIETISENLIIQERL